jgi:predicted DNA-binding transcriptional regulator YafY
MRKDSFRDNRQTWIMLETSARLLRLLSLLEARRDWTGPQLAERLGVTTRTIRNDIERLRNLGYPVDAAPGVSGGYRLSMGATLPPLLLDDDEAIAVAIGLRTAAGGPVTGIEESSVRALAKLERLLPSRLRHRIGTLAATILTLPGPGAPVDAGTLTTIAAACRDHERLRFGYHAHDGADTVRVTEPYRLVSSGRRWYLLAWDVGRQDWRTFRVDQMDLRLPAQTDAGRGGYRSPVSRAGHGDLALPGAGNGRCPGRRDIGPAARRDHGGVGGAGHLRNRGRL